MSSADEAALDAELRRADPDRWLSSRFVVDPAARADLVALYAFDAEMARIPTLVTEPLIGEIRFAWWREGLDEIAAGGAVRTHPILQALTRAAPRLEIAPLQGVIAARSLALYPEPVADAAELLARVDATAGAVTALAARRLDPRGDIALTVAAARAWALGRARLSHEPSVDHAALLAEALGRARVDAARLPNAAFPAVAHATLARMRRGGGLQARLRVLLAVATGRV
jgi:phytoene synthase